VLERAKAFHALDREAIVIEMYPYYSRLISKRFQFLKLQGSDNLLDELKIYHKELYLVKLFPEPRTKPGTSRILFTSVNPSTEMFIVVLDMRLAK
jgi:hypothetical protein